MKPHPRLVTVASGLVILGMLLSGAYLLIAEPWRQRQRLPGGSTVTLWGSTYGKQHAFDERQGWRGLLPQQRRPPRAGRWGSAGPVFTHSTSADALVGWLGRTGSKRSGALLFQSGPVDEHGCEFGTGSSPGLIGPWTSRLGELACIQLMVFPRRGSTFALEFREMETAQPRARFTLASRAPGPYPIWTPEPYPITKQSGPVTFTLNSLQPMDRRTWRGVTAIFDATERGRRSENWKPLHATVSDATGNSLRVPVSNYAPVGVCPLPTLCRQETAWKLRMAFAPVDPGATPADDLWKIQGIPAPQVNGDTQCRDQFSRSGLTLRLDRVLGVGMVRQHVWFPKKPFAVATVTAAGHGLRLTLVEARDDQGRDLIPPRGSGLAAGLEGAASQTYWLPEQSHHFGLVIPKDARTLNLVFAVHQARTVEFLARP